MFNGFIIIKRQLMDPHKHKIFGIPELWQMFCYLLKQASIKTQYVSFRSGRGMDSIEINRGQLVTGRSLLADALNIKCSTAWKRLLRIRELGYITMDSSKLNNRGTIITIVNYEDYQSSKDFSEHPKEQARSTHSDTPRQRAEEKKDKKEKKASPPIPPPRGGKRAVVDKPSSIDDVLEYAHSRGVYDDNWTRTQFWDYYEAGDWHDKDGKPVRNWKQKFITRSGSRPNANYSGTPRHQVTCQTDNPKPTPKPPEPEIRKKKVRKCLGLDRETQRMVYKDVWVGPDDPLYHKVW